MGQKNFFRKKKKKEKSGRKTRYGIAKRFFDIIFSLLLLIMLALPMLIIACAICLTSSGGALFRQVRIGRNGAPFICYKFRTMYRGAPTHCPTSKLVNASRYITPVGRFLRRTSLDELPQLWNVFWGDMSLIGPRPLIGEEGEIHQLRKENGVYAVRPGITGLAQISGRDMLDDREKVQLDIRYCNTMGFLMDARILGSTVLRVLSGVGIADERPKKAR